MSKRSWILMFIGLGMFTALICGGMIGGFVWIVGSSGQTSGPIFGDAVALIRVNGIIIPGEAPPPNPFTADSGGVAYSQTIIKYLKEANADSNIKTVVLAVDSPGGSVYASDEIYLQVLEMDKPIIVSMGNLAASGGYYVSAPAQEIWASPHTLTCSIGVISQFLNVSEFSEQFGVGTITLKSGKFKDTGNAFREFTAEDRALWQTIIDEAYAEFVRIVAEGRNMDEAEVRLKADGRICTGKQAQEMGLVDQLGYLPEVIDRAAELGGISGEPQVKEYGVQTGLFEALGSQLTVSQPSPVDELKQLLNYHPGSPLMYLYVGP